MQQHATTDLRSSGQSSLIDRMAWRWHAAVKPSKPLANTAAAGTTDATHQQQQQRNKTWLNYNAKPK
jgi:hypothetical protein